MSVSVVVVVVVVVVAQQLFSSRQTSSRLRKSASKSSRSQQMPNSSWDGDFRQYLWCRRRQSFRSDHRPQSAPATSGPRYSKNAK